MYFISLKLHLQIRMSALKILLLKSNKNYLETFLTYNLPNISMATRKEVVATSKKFFKNKDNATKGIFRCLMTGFEVDANHSRRSLCLEMLTMMCETFEADCFLDFWLENDIALLIVAILNDRYEVNQKMGMDLLKKFSREKLVDVS